MRRASNWKYVIPIIRAEETEDGFFLEGEASGPERDNHGTRMSKEAIQDFARQIADRVETGNPLPYIDQHLKVGVARQLGDVIAGFVNPDNHHLRVRVQLDEDNPNAMMIHKKIALRGKQYGMSIAGNGIEFDWERDESGAKYPVFNHVDLSEISHTPAPSWSPSFGTVLARSLTEDGQEIEMSDELDTTAAVEQTTVTEAEQETPVASDENVALSTEEATAEVEASEETTEENIENTDEVEEPEVERARIAQADKDNILAAFGNLATQLRNLGIDPAAAVVAPAEEATATEPQPVENSENGETMTITREMVAEMVAEAVKPFSEQIDRQNEYIQALENLPAGKKPAPLVREKFESDKPNLEAMSPEERMRYALETIYAN
jgi:hypothetical protein